MSERDDETRAQREREIPAGIIHATARSPHLMAAATTYLHTGDHGAWARCFDALRADCERLGVEIARHGGAAMERLVGTWPEGVPEGGAAMTGAQATALVRAAEVQRTMLDAVCYCAMTSAPPIFVRVD